MNANLGNYKRKYENENYATLEMYAMAYKYHQTTTTGNSLFNYIKELMNTEKKARTRVNVMFAMETLSEKEKEMVRKAETLDEAIEMTRLIMLDKPPMRQILMSDLDRLLPIIERLLNEATGRNP